MQEHEPEETFGLFVKTISNLSEDQIKELAALGVNVTAYGLGIFTRYSTIEQIKALEQKEYVVSLSGAETLHTESPQL